MNCLGEIINMWLRGKYIVNEEQFRLLIDDIEPRFWKNIDLKYLSKDFFREFKHKFEWRDNWGGLTSVAIHVWKKFGEKFLDEMSFDVVRRKKN